jgi:SAM-dependent methyltransferase
MANIDQNINAGIGSDDYFQKYYISRDWHIYRDVLAEILRYAEPGPVLDLGAGLGFAVEGFQRWGINAVGIEGSSGAVKMGQERFRGIDLRCQPLSEKLPFEDGDFSAVIINQVIEHLEPEVAEHCIIESYRVLKGSGVIYVTSPSRFNRSEAKADPTHINMFTPRRLKLLLLSAGFEGIIEINSPLLFLGRNKVGSTVMRLMQKVVRWDCLSATANCIAFKSQFK